MLEFKNYPPNDPSDIVLMDDFKTTFEWSLDHSIAGENTAFNYATSAGMMIAGAMKGEPLEKVMEYTQHIKDEVQQLRSDSLPSVFCREINYSIRNTIERCERVQRSQVA